MEWRLAVENLTSGLKVGQESRDIKCTKDEQLLDVFRNEDEEEQGELYRTVE